MGQYYKSVSIEKKEHVLSHSYDSGLKLMEHSWLNNSFVKAVCTLIAIGGAWYGDRIVWAGDYADPEPNTENDENEGRGDNLYHICNTEVKPDVPKKEFRYVINMDTKEFVDTKKIPISDIWTDDKGKEWPFIIGKWARARVSVTDEVPTDYKELKFNLYEGKKPMKLTPKPKKAKVTA
jgi:hypothetical protein